MNNTSLILNIRNLRRVLRAGDSVSAEIADTMREIRDDKDHSEGWKSDRLAKAQQVKNEELRKLGSTAMELIEKLDEQITSRRESFDHRDSTFQAALTTLQVYGKACPFDVRESIVKSLHGNYKGLKAIKAAFEAYNLPTDSITETIGILDSMGTAEAGAISEFVGYAISDLTVDGVSVKNEWRSRNITRMLDQYERALNIDSSTNPVLARLDAVINDPNTKPDIKERATSWRRGHAESLEDDDAHAMKTTEAMLNTWENGNK